MGLLTLWDCWFCGIAGSLGLLVLWGCWFFGVVGSFRLLAFFTEADDDISAQLPSVAILGGPIVHNILRF